MNGTLTKEEQAELDGLNSTGLTIAEQAELDELNGVKKKQTSQPTSTSSSTPVKQESTPSLPNGEVDFLAQANALQPSLEQQREEQFQQTGTTGQADLKKESVKLADKQLEKNNIQT